MAQLFLFYTSNWQLTDHKLQTYCLLKQVNFGGYLELDQCFDHPETNLNILQMSPLRSRSCENKLFHYIVQMTCSPRTRNSISWNTSNVVDNVHLWKSQHIAFFDVVEIHHITLARLLFSSCNSVMKMYHTCPQKQCKLTYYIVSRG